MKQVKDDPELLEIMLNDLEQAPKLYHPTNYWACYQGEITEHLRTHSLKDFRSSTGGRLASFGATDLHPLKKVLETVSLPDLSKEDLNKVLYFLFLAVKNPSIKILPLHVSIDDLNETAYRVADLYGKSTGAKPLAELEASLNGTPEYSFTIKGKHYTHSFLYYYMRYCYCCQYCSFDKLDNIVELASGGGNQIEIIKKLHPHLSIYALDLTPQLYICSQYLKSLFPKEAVDYRKTKALTSISIEEPGQIVFLGNWQIKNLKPKGSTLFWSAASFGEMEPEIVSHYLEVVSSFAEFVYLFQCEKGKREGKSGEIRRVLHSTTWEHYRSFLEKNYRLVDHSYAYAPLKRMEENSFYFDAFWQKK